ncbi:MAG: glycoside hydrolase family 43 protein [Clostridia bacterium]|nr:glycoside hydrolase family 43 protein [Clostridia bacterium]
MKYTNPILPGFHPDPSICRVGDDFYLITSTFEFFPGVPIYHSKNLVNWELINYCLTENSQLSLKRGKPSSGIYAPTLRYHDGTFFMTATNVTRGGNFIVHTKDIRGKWSEPAWVRQAGIDPSLFWDDDGTCYFVSNGSEHPIRDGNGIFLCEIDPMTGKLLSPSRRISNGCGGRCPEAPHIYKRNGRYYLMLAEGGTEYGHMVTIQRARNIYGPYENCPHNPLLTHRDDPGPIQSTGHADIVEDPNGNWWLVCLGIRPLPGVMLHHLGRETFLAPLTWQEDGWPTVGRNRELDFEMDGPLPGPAPHPISLDFEEHFESDVLNLRWNFVRNPKRECYRPEKGRLVMIAGEDTLSTPRGTPTMIAVRQQAFRMETVARLTGDIQIAQCAGLTAFYNNDYHYDILITREEDGKHYICLRKHVADIDVVVARHPIDYRGAIRLKIESDEEWYTFCYEKDGDYVVLGRGRTSLLCTEITHTMTFTGTYWGVFTEGGEIDVTDVSVREVKPM